ncbi:DegT/DnrJ/EryC1/StrS family aminotransferase [Kineosporia mesophila]|uniref:DegT/DnrJ/EryC1/StrS family aminotransferase n=1 Tax=Kineosporia mesophila TaxID=566012 RepID=A0ABP6YZD7_9ACTN|nr:DegT/DnrJ/EryC1/StrS family aminotransferase [Kineosporia mesophila]MCD5350983.1 DegT/DnrJ/EryC1/StrS family aminotransferase [Kineosporia mesophila]
MTTDLTADAPSLVEPVPLTDLALMHAPIAAEVEQGLAGVMAAGAFVGGPAVGRFEDAFAAYSGRAHCVGVANGTDALEMALRACDVTAGDEVIIPANTFIATAEAVVRAGGVPVPVDVTAGALLIDPERAAAAITPRTRVLLPVHLFGQQAPMAPLRDLAAERGLVLIEDAAQAQGSTQNGQGIGTGAVAAATSFYPGKNLGAYGDAGAVVCDDPAVAARLRRIGNHGCERKYVHSEFGFTSRLDTFQAVVLEAKLRHLDGWNAQRARAAALYDELLADSEVAVPVTAPGNRHVWHLYVVRVRRRESVLRALNAAGIGAAVHYPIPVHRQPAFAGTARSPLPVTERASEEILSLPMFPGITPDQQERVVRSLARAL